MDVLLKGYWIGQSVTFVPKDFTRDLENYFHILDLGHDVSVLSEPDIHFCFFYYREPYHSLFETTVKLCRNLNKQVILIYDEEPPLDIEQADIIFDSFDTTIGDAHLWSKELSSRIHFEFTHHQEILDINKLAAKQGQKHISKDLVEMLKYIEKNLSRTIREEDVADYCHYSVTYFSKFFHKTIGISFRDYLTLKRINLAKQLLVSDRKEKISFIAFQCGYNDVSYFSRIFKKKTGTTPAIYRQLH